MNDLSFARPEAFALALLVLLVLACWWLVARQGRRQAASYWRDARPGYGSLALLVGLVAFAMATVAAAQPRWGTSDVPIVRTGADVIVVLDVSRSMNAADIPPSRLEAAKSAIVAALERGGGERVGLIVFGGSARLQFPLTTDVAAAALVIQRVEAGAAFVAGGSAVGEALDLARFSFDDDSDAGRLVILVTDGEDLSNDPVPAARRLSSAGVSLLIAGAATEAGAPVPVFSPEGDVQFLEVDGQQVSSRLDAPLLTRVAAAANGRYLGNNLDSLPGAVASRVAALESARIAEAPAEVPVERFDLFGAAAAAILGILMAMGALASLVERRRRRVGLALAALALTVISSACATEAFERNEAGLESFAIGDLDAAIASFQAAAEAEPGDHAITLNLALAYHAAGNFAGAERAAIRAAASPDREIRVAALSALGHHRFELGDLPGALEAFHDALVLAPHDDVVRRDYEVTWALLNPPPLDDEEPGEPGDGETPAPGDTPGPGQPGGTPTPQPGEPAGTPTPGPGGEGTPGPGSGSSASELQDRIDEIDAEVRAIQEEAADDLSFEDAIRILGLTAERNRLSALLSGDFDNTDPNDR